MKIVSAAAIAALVIFLTIVVYWQRELLSMKDAEVKKQKALADYWERMDSIKDFRGRGPIEARSGSILLSAQFL